MGLVILIVLFFLVSLIGGIIGSIKSYFRSDEDDGEDYYEKHHIPKTNKVWGSYEKYLQSSVWKAKRYSVLKRADHQCEVDGCDRKAVEVHHEKYPKWWGNEPLDYLIAVCGPCHDEFHPEKPDRHMSAEEAKKKIEEMASESKSGS